MQTTFSTLSRAPKFPLPLSTPATQANSEDALSSFIGYYELAEESGANFVPQNTSTESSTVQFDTIPTQSFASSQNADINPTLKGVLVRT